MHPVLFRLPIVDFPIHTYGLMIALGFLIGMQLGAREARRIDLSEKGDFERFIHDLTFRLIIAGLVGARVLFIIAEWETDYARDPLKIFFIWEGGLVFYGGFIGATLYSMWFCYRRKQNFLLVADVLVPSVALGHFFGRIGCFAAGCCWGDPVSPDFPLAVQFPAGSLVFNTMVREGIISHSATHTIHLHPVQLYESFGELIIFFILIFARTQKRFHGQTLLVYLFIYPILRTSLEFIRGDAARGENVLFGLSTSQLISAMVTAAAAIALVVLIRRKTASPSSVPPRSSGAAASPR